MIHALDPLVCGNAVSITLSPPAGATKWRLLRNATGTFTGAFDAGAYLAGEGVGDEDENRVDYANLVNGTPVFYGVFYTLGGINWYQSGASKSVIPSYSAWQGVITVDPVPFVRERLDLALVAEVAAGNLVPASGRIPVLLAPPQWESTSFPVVTVRLESLSQAERGLGEILMGDEDAIGGVFHAEGWIDQVQIQIVAWSLNPDERATLRAVLERILISNLPVLDAASFMRVEMSMSDQEDFSTYNAPVYQAMANLSFMRPIQVGRVYQPISSTEATML